MRNEFFLGSSVLSLILIIVCIATDDFIMFGLFCVTSVVSMTLCISILLDWYKMHSIESYNGTYKYLIAFKIKNKMYEVKVRTQQERLEVLKIFERRNITEYVIKKL